MRRPRFIVHARPVGAERGARAVEVDGNAHELLPLGDAVREELVWTQPAMFRREWWLGSPRGEHVLLHPAGMSRRKCVVETPDTTWKLSRSWLGEVIMADVKGARLARMPNGWFGNSRLERPAGPPLPWRRNWRGEHWLEDEHGHELLRVRRRMNFVRFEATVTVTDGGRRRDDLTELLAVTFFAWLSRPRGHAH